MSEIRREKEMVTGRGVGRSRKRRGKRKKEDYGDYVDKEANKRGIRITE